MLAKSKSIRQRDYAPGVFDLFKVNGKTYGIPAIEVGPWHGLITNDDLFSAAGMNAAAVPATLEELLQTHKKLTRTDGEKITQLGMSPITGISGNYFPEVWPFLYDLTLYNPAKRQINVNTEGMRSVFAYLQSFFTSVTAAQVQDFDKRNGASWNGMAAGTLAMQNNGYYTVGNLTKAGAQKNYHFSYNWVPNTRKDKMQVVGGWGMTIPTGAANIKEAFRVMEYLTSPPAAKMIYDNKGWLNGNMMAMRQLDSRENPGIAWYIEALATANRVRVPENIPIIADVRSVLNKQAWAVARGEVSPDQALADAQITLDAALDSSFKN
jgi:ABC-type glycerol-3-phosphate transport system substrate-binding protein